MGIQLKGAFGGFSGKTGNLIGRYLKGQNVITSLLRPSTKPPTQKQIDQRYKFALVSNYLSYISPLVERGFQEHKRALTPMNAAVAYNLKYAIEGATPNFEINPLQVSFSRGKLVGPNGSSMESVAGAKIKFEWLASSVASPLSNPADQLTVMVYNPTKKLFVTLMDAALRSALTYTITCPAEFVGDDVYGYLSFVGINGKVSNSTFVGTVVIL